MGDESERRRSREKGERKIYQFKQSYTYLMNESELINIEKKLSKGKWKYILIDGVLVMGFTWGTLFLFGTNIFLQDPITPNSLITKYIFGLIFGFIMGIFTWYYYNSEVKKYHQSKKSVKK